MSTTFDFPATAPGSSGRRTRSKPTTNRMEPVSPPSAAVLALLEEAEHGLAAAECEPDPAQRFTQAYLSALRAAAAVLAMRGRPHRGNFQPASVWSLLSGMVPELREWAAFFASESAVRAKVQAGITRVVTARTADDLVRQTGQFIGLADRVCRRDRRRDGRRT